MKAKAINKPAIAVEPIGVYPVKATQPCHLIELRLIGKGDVNFGDFTQEQPDRDRSQWQVAYDEHVLDEAGMKGQLAPFPGPLKIKGEVRVAFFFHDYKEELPLLTLWGNIKLPQATRRPKRLSFMKYESPC